MAIGEKAVNANMNKDKQNINILFLLKTLNVGGVEVVTTVLANKFVAEGHNVVVWVFFSGNTSLADRLDSRVKLCYGDGLNARRHNVASLRNVLINENIDVVVNQWGLPFVPMRTLRKAAFGLGMKIISVYHNDPNFNGRTQMVKLAISQCHNAAKKKLLGWKLTIFKRITAASMRYVYRHSDRYMVLSKSFVKHFENFTGIHHADKLVVQTNPVTIDAPACQISLNTKRKEVVYVGRLDNQQKRVSRIIDVWALVGSKHQDWALRFVGDGEERAELERQCDRLNLKNVSFEGFKHPAEYYARASVLILTSEYEGFPLVLAESMSFGVVPVVYGSFSSAYDIIRSGENGVIVKPNGEQFSTEAMAETVERIMNDDSKRADMARQAIATSREYSVDTIYSQWMDLFRVLWKND